MKNVRSIRRDYSRAFQIKCNPWQRVKQSGDLVKNFTTVFLSNIKYKVKNKKKVKLLWVIFHLNPNPFPLWRAQLSAARSSSRALIVRSFARSHNVKSGPSALDLAAQAILSTTHSRSLWVEPACKFRIRANWTNPKTKESNSCQSSWGSKRNTLVEIYDQNRILSFTFNFQE